jgi:hypothetical protein
MKGHSLLIELALKKINQVPFFSTTNVLYLSILKVGIFNPFTASCENAMSL